MTRELKCPNCGIEFDWVDVDLRWNGYSEDSIYCYQTGKCRHCKKSFNFTEIYRSVGYDDIELCD